MSNRDGQQPFVYFYFSRQGLASGDPWTSGTHLFTRNMCSYVLQISPHAVGHLYHRYFLPLRISFGLQVCWSRLSARLLTLLVTMQSLLLKAAAIVQPSESNTLTYVASGVSGQEGGHRQARGQLGSDSTRSEVIAWLTAASASASASASAPVAALSLLCLQVVVALGIAAYLGEAKGGQWDGRMAVGWTTPLRSTPVSSCTSRPSLAGQR